jgi:hypothetical protein
LIDLVDVFAHDTRNVTPSIALGTLMFAAVTITGRFSLRARIWSALSRLEQAGSGANTARAVIRTVTIRIVGES